MLSHTLNWPTSLYTYPQKVLFRNKQTKNTKELLIYVPLENGRSKDAMLDNHFILCWEKPVNSQVSTLQVAVV